MMFCRPLAPPGIGGDGWWPASYWNGGWSTCPRARGWRWTELAV